MIIAKTDENEHILPLEVHLSDTAGVAELLAQKVITDAEIRACGLTADEFRMMLTFLAFVHDIGKDTAFFQSMIMEGMDKEVKEILKTNGRNVLPLSHYTDPYIVHHSYAGEEILADKSSETYVDRSIAVIVGAHHGRPGSVRRVSFMDMYRKNFIGRKEDEGEWHRDWTEIIKEAARRSGAGKELLQKKLPPRAQIILAGYVTWADWIASNTDYFPLMDIKEALSFEQKAKDKKEHILYERISKASQKLFFLNSWTPSAERMDDDMFRDRFGFKPNRIQKALINVAVGADTPGIYILEAETGNGKTEASIAAATILASKFKQGGIFYALPTQASSNAMFSRLLPWADAESADAALSIRLAHSAAHLNDDFEELYYTKRDNGNAGFGCIGVGAYPLLEGNKRTLMSNFVIGTVDQFLMCALKRKHVFLRHIGISGKVLIIDECHAYDAYMDSRFEDALKWAGYLNVPVILLSATLPARKREDFITAYLKGKAEAEDSRIKKKEIRNRLLSGNEYPLLTWTDGGSVYQSKIQGAGKTKRVRITRINGERAAADYIAEKLAEGGCAEIIANTVRDAQKMYEIFQSDGRFRTVLYHASFTGTDRTRKEKEILNLIGKNSTAEKRNMTVIIGTQPLEQSLDTDADILITQPCPADSLVQRIGRLFRHERADRPDGFTEPECVLWMDKDGGIPIGTKYVYLEYPVKRTLDVLGGYLRIPEDVPYLVNTVYDTSSLTEKEKADYHDTLAPYMDAIKSKRIKAKESFSLGLPDGTIEGMLVNSDVLPEDRGAGGTRDIDDTIDVIVLAACGNDMATPAGSAKKAYAVPTKMPPGFKEARAVIREKVRLPRFFSSPWNFERTVGELKKSTESLCGWKESKILAKELVLLLDGNGNGELCGKKIHYDFELGFTYYG